MKKIRSASIYLLFVIIGAVILFPVLIAVILPIQDSDELQRTFAPLAYISDKYVKIDYIPQYPTLKNGSAKKTL